MKKYKIIKLVNSNKYFENFDAESRGIVLEENAKSYKTLFLNKLCLGDYAIKDIEKYDAVIENADLPNNIAENLEKSLNKLLKNSKTEFEKAKFKQFDEVMLIDDKGKYKKFGLNSGDTGVVIEDISITGSVFVDFSKQTKENPYGDVISIDVTDLKP